MGVNNKQRRAAKQRQRAGQRSGRPQGGSRDSFTDDLGGGMAEELGYVSFEVTKAVRRIGRSKHNEAELAQRAEMLLRSVHPCPLHVVATVLGDLLSQLADDVVRGGWGPADLDQLVRRNAGEEHLDTLGAVLREESRRNKRNARTWLAAVDEVGSVAQLSLDTPQGLASGLQVAALLGTAPLLEADTLPVGQGSGSSESEHPKLARVRALLAKAESTEYDEEAEALSAKAQELISQYALGRLLGESTARVASHAPQVRRIWLDAPYVRAKAQLVHEVASANRCRSVLTDSLGFCLVVGAAGDLDAVELLVTSLLVQANRAMLRHGRRSDAWGVARTRSFRRSFLLAYAARIGQRLRAATEAATAEEGGALLPVLRDHEERVAEAFTAMVPHTTRRTASISNGEGWVAGLAAADVAQLDVNAEIVDRAG